MRSQGAVLRISPRELPLETRDVVAALKQNEWRFLLPQFEWYHGNYFVSYFVWDDFLLEVYNERANRKTAGAV